MSWLLNRGKKHGHPPLPEMPTSATNRVAKKDYSVKPWTDYFEERQQIKVGPNNFQVYRTGRTGTLIVFLHGGGFSGLTWALLAKSLSTTVECQCVAPDLRGHGGTSTGNDSDLSAATLAGDICDVVEAVSDDDTKVVLIGHSMGGAIAVHAAALNRLTRLAALIVIDVVEGTALEALHSMHHILQNRPRSFESVEKANEWCVRSGYIRNLESARVSMIGQLKRRTKPSESVDSSHVTDCIPEEADADEYNQHPATTSSDKSASYEWRIDLSRTEPYWEGWFKGLSPLFLSVPVPKVLLLAGVDRLDRDLSIGQMQGKFQLQVMQRSGHVVHEDNPHQVAQVISNFLTRHKLCPLVTQPS